jgi:hypothetical protein
MGLDHDLGKNGTEAGREASRRTSAEWDTSMNRPHASRWLAPWIALVCAPGPSAARAVGPPALEGPTESPAAREGRVLPRSPDPISPHETIGSPPNGREPERIGSAPPPPIAERPGNAPPGPTAQWIEGSWEWDGARQDFVWVTGSWQVPPPGKFWVNGFWRRDDRGWHHVPGFWCARRDEAAAVASPAPAPDASTPTGRTVLEASGTVGGTAPAPMAPLDSTTTRTVARPQFAAPDPSEAATRPVTSTEPPAMTSPATVTASASPAVAPAPTVATASPVVATSSPVVALADQLAGQAAAFEQVFGMTAHVTPAGGAFLADARQLRGAALGLRQAAAAGDADRMRLAFGAISTTWRRMVDRANRIAPGRTGPNIEQIWRMGETAAGIGRLMP